MMHIVDYNSSEELQRLGFRIPSQHDWPLDKTIQFLSQTGFKAVEFSLNHNELSPDALSGGRLDELKAELDDNELHVYALSFRCNETTAMNQSLDLLKKGMEVAQGLGTNLMILCPAPLKLDPSGRVTSSLLTDLLQQAQQMGLIIALEPEPDSAVHGMYEFSQLANRLTGLPLGLDLNVAHCACTEGNVDEVIAEWAPFIVSAHISDAERDTHHHLVPGEGHLDINRAVKALRRYRYEGDLILDVEKDGASFEEVVLKTMENCKQLFC